MFGFRNKPGRKLQKLLFRAISLLVFENAFRHLFCLQGLHAIHPNLATEARAEMDPLTDREPRFCVWPAKACRAETSPNN